MPTLYMWNGDNTNDGVLKLMYDHYFHSQVIKVYLSPDEAEITIKQTLSKEIMELPLLVAGHGMGRRGISGLDNIKGFVTGSDAYDYIKVKSEPVYADTPTDFFESTANQMGSVVYSTDDTTTKPWTVTFNGSAEDFVVLDIGD